MDPPFPYTTLVRSRELGVGGHVLGGIAGAATEHPALGARLGEAGVRPAGADARALEVQRRLGDHPAVALAADEVCVGHDRVVEEHLVRSDEHTSELQSLMRNSYAVFCLKK